MTINQRKTMVVGRVDNQGDRVILYKSATELPGDEFHVIAPAKAKVQPGDTIEYEPYGFNFGWLIDE